MFTTSGTYPLSFLTQIFQIGQPSHGDFNLAKRNPWFSSFLVNSTQKETRNGGVMVSVLASSAVDRGFEHQSGQTKDYKIGICCFYTKHVALRRRTSWLVIRIMCQSGTMCLPADCCFSELAL